MKFLMLIPFACALSAWAGTPSDSVPTNALLANFILSQQSPGTPLAIGVDLEALAAVNGVQQNTPLDLSADESLSFSGGGSSVVYTNGANDSLPASAGGTYSFAYKRSNGESYSGTVTLPPVTQFTAPAPNSVFHDSDGVHVTWVSQSSDMQMIMISSNCASLVDNSSVDESGSGITFAANLASQCTGTPQVEVDIVGANGGSGFGTFSGSVTSSVTFSYSAGTTTTSSSSASLLRQLTSAEVARWIQIARRTNQHVFRLLR